MVDEFTENVSSTTHIERSERKSFIYQWIIFIHINTRMYQIRVQPGIYYWVNYGLTFLLYNARFTGLILIVVSNALTRNEIMLKNDDLLYALNICFTIRLRIF